MGITDPTASVIPHARPASSAPNPQPPHPAPPALHPEPRHERRAEYLGPSLLFMTLVPFLAHLTAGRFTAYGQIPPTRLH